MKWTIFVELRLNYMQLQSLLIYLCSEFTYQFEFDLRLECFFHSASKILLPFWAFPDSRHLLSVLECLIKQDTPKANHLPLNLKYLRYVCKLLKVNTQMCTKLFRIMMSLHFSFFFTLHMYFAWFILLLEAMPLNYTYQSSRNEIKLRNSLRNVT